MLFWKFIILMANMARVFPGAKKENDEYIRDKSFLSEEGDKLTINSYIRQDWYKESKLREYANAILPKIDEIIDAYMQITQEMSYDDGFSIRRNIIKTYFWDGTKNISTVEEDMKTNANE